MTTVVSPGTGSRRPPTAECRLCSARMTIDAPTPDDLRHGLRGFMAIHRHDGMADIIIDLCDEDEPAPLIRR